MPATQVELKTETQELISELVGDSYAVDDIYEFIAEYGESNFVEHYENYVQFGESHSYEAVDAFIEEFGIDNFQSFEDAYRGEWNSKAEYAENYVTDCYSIDHPGFLEIDWEATFDNLDCVYSNGFVFDSQF
jgi:Antirestriction protein (ArdA).